MKKQIIIVLATMILAIAGGCGKSAGSSASESGSALESTSPVEKEYNDLYSELQSEEGDLELLIAEAENKLQNTSESAVADASVLESLSDSIEKAKQYEKYAISSGNEEKSQAELTNLRNAYDMVSQIRQSLSTAISDVDESVAEMERIENEKIDEQIWPGTTYTFEITDRNGFTAEVKLKFGNGLRQTI